MKPKKISASTKTANLKTKADFLPTLQDPLQDWQVAGLAFLVCKGGLYWGTGSFDVEGKANIAAYRAEALKAGRTSLVAYIDNVDTALTGNPALQQQYADVQVRMKAFMTAMIDQSAWTYCGFLDAATLTTMVAKG